MNDCPPVREDEGEPQRAPLQFFVYFVKPNLADLSFFFCFHIILYKASQGIERYHL